MEVLSTDKMDCSICINKFNKSYRKEVQCLYCGHSACQKCVERFLVENTIQPKCMSCNAEWNMEFLRLNLSRSFMDKDYKEHQANSLLVEAEAEIGHYQDLAAFDIKKEEAMRAYEEARKKWKQSKAEMDRAMRNYWRIANSGPVEKSDRAEFFLACPRHDCRGRISTGYKCGMCEHHFCSKCHGDKGTNREAPHECNQDDIDTVKLLHENTRNCPKCKTGIFKTQGCDQMWCVSCHTAFSWKSGNILNGPIHNPEFYDYQRRHGVVLQRQPGDVICGGLPTNWEMMNFIRSLPDGRQTHDDLLHIHRLALHIENITMPAIYRKYNRRPELLRTHGVAYLRGRIDRKTWRDAMYKATRQEEKYRRYYQILETLTTNIAELMRQFIARQLTSEETFNGCNELFSYTNTACDKMKKQFKMTIPTFAPRMNTNRI